MNSFPAVLHALALACAGHKALSLAEGSEPLYLGNVSYSMPWAANRLDEVPETVKLMMPTAVPEYMTVWMRIPIPSASDAATWALVAADMFRESAILAARVLDPNQCPAAELNKTITTGKGKTINLMDSVASTLSDSMLSMVEAAEKAQKLVAAAAEAKLAGTGDYQSGTIAAWRARVDSRLEAANIFVPVAEERFDTRQARALYEMRKDGSEGHHYYTTLPELPEPGYSPVRVVGYVYPIDMPNPPSSLNKLVTYRVNGLLLTSDNGSTWGQLTTGWTVVREEGYVPASPTGDTVDYRHYKCGAGTAADPYRYYWPLNGSTIPSNCVTASDRNLVFPAPFEVENTTGRYPLVLSNPDTAGARRAVQLLRSLKIDPRLTSTRTRDVVATEVMRALQAKYYGAFASATTGLAIMNRLGITLDELERAARYIEQVAVVMGLSIRADPASPATYQTVIDLSEPRRPPPPPLLYARTAGYVSFKPFFENGYTTKGAITANTAEPGPAYARSSIISAIDYFRWLVTVPATNVFDSARFNNTTVGAVTSTSTTLKALQQLLGWSEQYVGPRVRATFVNSASVANSIDSITLVVDGLGYTSANANTLAKSELGLWYGYAGLECALSDTVYGLPCNAAEYRFGQSASWSVGDPGAVDLPTRNALLIKVLKADGTATNSAGIDTSGTLYLVRRAGDGTRAVVTAFKPPAMAAGGYSTIWLTPYSEYTAQVLADGLGASPRAPEKAAISCAGVPYDTKVKLEDELTEAFDGKDSIESSFAHYLRSAELAASEADSLGDQLVDQGLKMDMRQEEARDGLEDLCGGVIDVGRLQDYACSANTSCDIGALLAAPGSIGDSQTRNDVEGLKRCLGVGDPPVDAVLGDSERCVWHATYGGRTYPACVCPNNDSICTKLPCFSSPTGGQCTPNIGSASVSVAYSPTVPLNLSVTSLPPQDTTNKDWTKFSCLNLMNLREHYARGKTKGFVQDPVRESLSWIGQDTLKDIANGVGFEIDEYLFPTVTLGGKPFMRAGSAATGPANATDAWPCSRHLMADGNLADSDSLASDHCAAGRPGNDSLFCGRLCGPADTVGTQDHLFDRAVAQAKSMRHRLYYAVSTLKGISGASFRGFQSWRSTRSRGLPIYRDGVFVNSLPAWHPYAPGSAASRSGDRQQWCWTELDGDTNCITRPWYDKTPAMRLEVQFVSTWTNYLWYAGWPVNPAYSWMATFEGGEQTDPDYSLTVPTGSVGEMQELLAGTNPEVDLRMKTNCIKIPDDYRHPESYVPGADEYYDSTFREAYAVGSHGEELRSPGIWAQIVRHDKEETWSASEKAMLDCVVSTASLNAKVDYTRIFQVLDNPNENVYAALEACLPDACPGCGGGALVPPNNPFSYTLGTLRKEALYHLLAQHYDCAGAQNHELVGSNVPAEVVLDALEVACAVRDQGQVGCNTLLSESYPVSDVTDFASMQQMARCAADTVEDNLHNMLVTGFPQSVAEDIARGGVVNVFPPNRGLYGETVAKLAAEVITMQQHANSIVSALRDLSLALSRSRTESSILGLDRQIRSIDLYIKGLDLQALDIDKELDKIRFNQTITANVTRCVASLARASGNWFQDVTGQAVGAGIAATADCVDSGLQVMYEDQINGKEDQLRSINKDKIEAAKRAILLGQNVTDEQKKLVMFDVASKLNETMDRIDQAKTALLASHVAVQGYLAELDKHRSQAHRLAAKVLMLSSDDVGRQYAVNSSMRARMNTLRVRYERARDRAIGASYLARRAIEQKLGLDMSTMLDDMTTVAAPSTWVDKLCTLSGIDYGRIRKGGAAPGASSEENEDKVPSAYDYADGYVGDYVQKLSDFIDSYRLDYPSQDADALAVVSLRDEVINVRRTNEECEAQVGPNLLYYTDGQSSAEPGTEHAWEMPCANGQMVSMALPSTTVGNSPLLCGGLAECDKAAGRALTIGHRACAVLPVGEDLGDSNSAMSRLTYRLIGGACTTNSAASCADTAVPVGLTGALAAVGTGPLPTVTLVGGGIGNRKVIQATNGQGVSLTSNLTTAASAYVITAVASLSGSVDGAALHTIWSATTQEGSAGGQSSVGLRNTTGTIHLVVTQKVGTTTPVSLSTPLLGTGPWIISMRADSVADKVDLFVNGKKVAAYSSTAMQPSLLSSPLAVSVPTGSAAVLRVADLMTHEARLSDAEIGSIHQLLGMGYAIPTMVWSSATASQAVMRQTVAVTEGAYLLSWYQPIAPATATVTAFDGDVNLGFLQAMEGSAPAAVTNKRDPRMQPGWARYYGTIEVPDDALLTVGFAGEGVTISGVQLEPIYAQSLEPSPYFPTGATLEAPRASCEDTYGEEFRSRAHWTYGCEYFCPPGTGLDCGAGGQQQGLPKACFYETKFAMSLEEIEKGELIQQAGFARGNFNYRFDDFALNVVGTSVKNCELSDTPSSCYGNNNILYSIRHDEPFRIRNYEGSTVTADLYPGNIQQAQALVAERYITNPVSSADRNLLADYWHGELKGRPMDGNFRLRIYDSEGLDWNAIEDVQLVLRYRYWTREQ